MACILIAEDDPLFLRMLSAVCRGLFKDLTLLTAHNVEDAVAEFTTYYRQKHQLPDIVITDLRMPIRSHHSDYQAVKMAGLKLTQIVHKTYPTVPVLILSGVLDEEFILQTMESGAVNVMNKLTLDHHMLKRVLHRMLPGELFLSKER